MRFLRFTWANTLTVDAELNGSRYARMEDDVPDLPRYAKDARPPVYDNHAQEASSSAAQQEPMVFSDVGHSTKRAPLEIDDVIDVDAGSSSRQHLGRDRKAPTDHLEPNDGFDEPPVAKSSQDETQFSMSDVSKGPRDVQDESAYRSSIHKPRYELQTREEIGSTDDKSTYRNWETSDATRVSKEKIGEVSIDTKRSSIAKPPIALVTKSRDAPAEHDDYLAGIADEILGMPIKPPTSDKLKQEAERQAKWDAIQLPEPAMHAPLAVYRMNDIQCEYPRQSQSSDADLCFIRRRSSDPARHSSCSYPGRRRWQIRPLFAYCDSRAETERREAAQSSQPRDDRRDTSGQAV